nr:ABC transporter ATP-binding protein/permease [Treponema sp.]
YGFVFNTKREIGVRLMRDYMNENYSFFLKNNSSVLMRCIGGDVSIFFDMVLQCLYFFSDGFIIFFFGLFLFYTDFVLSAVCFCVMFLFVFVFVRWNKKRATYYGTEAQKSNGSVTQWLQQAFGGAKEIKILQREEYFIHNFEKHSVIANKMNQRFSFMNQIPHLVLECFCTAAILSVIVVRVLQGVDVTLFVPKMAVFAMALFRVFPRVSRLNQSVNTMIFSYPYLDTVYNDIKLTEDHQQIKKIAQDIGKKELALTFNTDIQLQHVSYTYPNTDVAVLSDISLTIKKGQAVGLVGASGAGKSTLADVFLGILELDSGSVLCDGKNIVNHAQEWSSKLGYIPQAIFLSDDTIRNNVAFGLEVNSDVDKKVWAALEQAQLADYVRTLPEGLDTMVGERGVRFSGGQRQRIGIARALYNNPEILVLDEATSALDNETEKAVMDSIESLLGHKTMIIIAHRITTIKNCDVIYKVDHGNVRKVSYDDLLAEVK